MMSGVRVGIESVRRARVIGPIALLVACAPAAWSPAQEGAVRLPPGFRIETFASGLGAPRMMAVSPSGDLFASVPSRGQIVTLPDRDRDGRADRVVVYAGGLDRPHGVAFFRGFLYAAETGAVVRFPYRPGDLAGGRPEVVVRDLPSGGGHWTRTIAFGPDGKMYVSVGSSCNVCEERDPRRAAILQFDPDGTGGRIFARGIRNAVGITVHPQTGELWATNNGRDWLGDDFPPDTVLVVKERAHYGWPYCNGRQVPDPEFGRPDFCKSTALPAVEIQAHSAPLGLSFYTGGVFPAEYRENLFVALHGSWNRTVPTGYKVIRIPMQGGGPGPPQDFAAGWLQGDRAWGRPVDVITGKDGALYVSDDRAGAIYRISYPAR
jgi:glucose/arabinose dehydrogenase